MIIKMGSDASVSRRSRRRLRAAGESSLIPNKGIEMIMGFKISMIRTNKDRFLCVFL